MKMIVGGGISAGKWLAWSTVALFVLYAVVLFAGGVVHGVPKEPYLAVAEILTMLSGPLLVTLMAVIHASVEPRARPFALAALGWMLVMAGLTISVHFVQLTVARTGAVAANPALARVFGWEWPSLLYGVELVAWHVSASPSCRPRSRSIVQVWTRSPACPC